MTDYGHELAFGSFITPANSRPEHAVDLAVLSEAVGLDLVTFQDHPYQPAFLDTWTLMSFVAAQTSSVTIAANVTNLPLRPPAVLARSVASLDLLSHGRIELGLGAGAFWDAIEAMGGHRLGGGDAVTALSEAIDIIRQTWDASARGGVRVEGDFYRVVGAKRGPAPAHDVGIWLGAYKPRMLELTGAVADGWLPSMSRMKPGELARGNELIDAAAIEARRDPVRIRRLLNITGDLAATSSGFLQGPTDQWVEELADLALSEGIGTFILGSDDPDVLRRYATEVAPAVREMVSVERAIPSPTDATEGAPPTASTVSPSASGLPPRRVEASISRTPFAVVPTPDDGVRLSDLAMWDEAERPTGPDRDPERLYSAHEQASGQHLIDVHDHLRGELAQIYNLLDQVQSGTLDVGAARSAINEMTMRQNNWVLGTYCESYCRVVTTHHTIEDQSLFPYMRQTEYGLAAVVDRLEYEHRIIHDVLDGVDRALVAYVSAEGDLADVRTSVDLLSDTLLSHLSYEERELVEPLARHGVF